MSIETKPSNVIVAENQPTVVVPAIKRRVFLLEDDPFIADSLSDALEYYGWNVAYKVTTVESKRYLA